MSAKRGFVDIGAGTFAGVMGTVFGHPLDTIKVRLQTQSNYKTAVDCAVQLFRNEGFFSFYRGLASPLFSLTILNMFSFGAYGQFNLLMKEFLTTHNLTQSNSWIYAIRYAITGAAVGGSASIISTPFEMVKVRLQLDNVTFKRYRGSLHCAGDIVRTEGIQLFYKGFVVNTVRETVFGAVYFGVYEYTKAMLKEHLPTLLPGASSSLLAIQLAGGCSGMAAWFASYPFDVVKSNIQGERNVVNSSEKRNALWYAKERYKKGGVAAFYSGIGPSVLRAFIVSGIRFSAYEFAFAQLSQLYHYEGDSSRS